MGLGFRVCDVYGIPLRLRGFRVLGAEGLGIFLRSGKSEGSLIYLRVALRRTRGAGVRVGGKKRKSIAPGLTLSVCFVFFFFFVGGG